jgi:hypothetical protein
MKNVFSMKNVSAMVVAGIFALASCSKSSDQPVSSTNATSINSESSADSYTNETADMSNSVTTNAGNSILGGARAEAVTFSGAILKRWDKRLACATVTINRTGTKDKPSGTITITWSGTSCSDTTGVQRSGSIVITYSGYWFIAGSTRTITYQNYTRGGIQINGTYIRRSLTTLTASDTSASTLSIQFRDSLVGGQLTFANGKTITRNKTVTVQWDVQKILGAYVPVDYKHLTGGSANGTLENGSTYTMTINSDIVYTEACLLIKDFIPVSGSKTLIITPSGGGSATTFTINYGSGQCNNNQITVTINGKSETITVNAAGN